LDPGELSSMLHFEPLPLRSYSTIEGCHLASPPLASVGLSYAGHPSSFSSYAGLPMRPSPLL
jgi:hypothetical protein